MGVKIIIEKFEYIKTLYAKKIFKDDFFIFEDVCIKNGKIYAKNGVLMQFISPDVIGFIENLTIKGPAAFNTLQMYVKPKWHKGSLHIYHHKFPQLIYDITVEDIDFSKNIEIDMAKMEIREDRFGMNVAQLEFGIKNRKLIIYEATIYHGTLEDVVKTFPKNVEKDIKRVTYYFGISDTNLKYIEKYNVEQAISIKPVEYLEKVRFTKIDGKTYFEGLYKGVRVVAPKTKKVKSVDTNYVFSITEIYKIAKYNPPRQMIKGKVSAPMKIENFIVIPGGDYND